MLDKTFLIPLSFRELRCLIAAGPWITMHSDRGQIPDSDIKSLADISKRMLKTLEKEVDDLPEDADEIRKITERLKTATDGAGGMAAAYGANFINRFLMLYPKMKKSLFAAALAFEGVNESGIDAQWEIFRESPLDYFVSCDTELQEKLVVNAFMNR